MGVQKDAGELLLFFYDELINKEKGGIDTQDVLNTTMWNGDRIDRAYNYLKRLKTIEVIEELGDTGGAQNFSVAELLPNGINIVESKPKFKETFGLEVNLGLLKFSWSVTEK